MEITPPSPPGTTLSEMVSTFIVDYGLQGADTVYAIDSNGRRVDLHPTDPASDGEIEDTMLTPPILVVVDHAGKRVGMIVQGEIH